MENFKENKTKEIRERSGTISSDDKLVCFLYTLMRDHLPAGIVEELVQDSEISWNNIMEETQKGRLETITYTNGWLAKYAIDLAERLK